MHVLMPTGISSSEILANCRLLKIPRERWDSIAYGVHLMMSAARPILQRRAMPAK